MTREPAHRLRIIGGQWRSRKVEIADVPGLRPTPDRVRETVFNWLQPVLPGARCLDLFAGSGALGFEALSRGAAEVVLIDSDRKVVETLRRQAAVLNAEGAQVMQADAQTFLRAPARTRYDVVFLDPPYSKALLQPCAELLEAGGWLRDSARIYLEAPAGEAPQLPPQWRLARSKRAGQVGYHLAERMAEAVGAE